MARNKVRRRADGNQPDIVKCIRELGASFQHTHTIPGALDGIIGFAGVDQRVEIKDPEQAPSRRTLTVEERDTFDNWRGRQPVVIETVGDVLAVLKVMTLKG
jgi:hypothetical protein